MIFPLSANFKHGRDADSKLYPFIFPLFYLILVVSRQFWYQSKHRASSQVNPEPKKKKKKNHARPISRQPPIPPNHHSPLFDFPFTNSLSDPTTLGSGLGTTAVGSKRSSKISTAPPPFSTLLTIMRLLLLSTTLKSDWWDHGFVHSEKELQLAATVIDTKSTAEHFFLFSFWYFVSFKQCILFTSVVTFKQSSVFYFLLKSIVVYFIILPKKKKRRKALLLWQPVAVLGP